MLFLPQFYKIANQNNWPSFHPTFHLKLWIILQLFGSKQPIVWLSMQLLLIIFFLLPQKSIYFSLPMYLSLSLQPAKVLRTKMQMDFQCFSQLCIDSLPRIFSTGQMKRKLDHMRISNGHQAFKKPKIQRNSKHFSILLYSFTQNNIQLLDQRQILPFRNNCVLRNNKEKTL